MKSKVISLAIHGGAGTISKNLMTPQKEKAYQDALREALEKGYQVLSEGKSALDAVEASVMLLEDSPLFNAGKGSVFTHDGLHEMDASLMDGQSKQAGAVAGITGIKNPIQLARVIMEKSEHLLFVGQGALNFAKEHHFELLDPAYFYDELRYRQWQEALKSGVTQLDHTPLKENKFGTVGAVALDMHGHLAAATSTGGMTNKKYGRVGDSPLIGSGTYANNATCAVSCTGSGEYFIRNVVAYQVSALMEFSKLDLTQAAEKVIHGSLLEMGGDGGLIAVDAQGNISMPFNTEGMYRACKNSLGLDAVNIYRA